MRNVFLSIVCFLSSVAYAQIQVRYNQVGCYPNQEKVIVVEGTNPAGKVRVNARGCFALVGQDTLSHQP